jgi:exodeoxyribonuclease III
VAKKRIKLISWNVNGLRAVMKKGFVDTFKTLGADVIGLQETKLQEHQRSDEMIHVDGYESHWAYSSVKKGYSGVAAYSRIPNVATNISLGRPEIDGEGRIIELDFGDFFFFNVYFPNGQMSAERLNFKLDFYRYFFDHADGYKNSGRSVVVTGDFNTAHNEIDLKNSKANQDRSGFLRIERDWLDTLMERGYVDTFRQLHPEAVKYSWWTYRFNSRARNIGWRIDYFWVTRDMLDKGWIKEAFIDNSVYGSDHCPIGLVLEI